MRALTSCDESSFDDNSHNSQFVTRCPTQFVTRCSCLRWKTDLAYLDDAVGAVHERVSRHHAHVRRPLEWAGPDELIG
eukprot:1616655-Rhodomonas_salina.3